MSEFQNNCHKELKFLEVFTYMHWVYFLCFFKKNLDIFLKDCMAFVLGMRVFKQDILVKTID